jgi:hypothetical protein
MNAGVAADFCWNWPFDAAHSPLWVATLNALVSLAPLDE